MVSLREQNLIFGVLTLSSKLSALIYMLCNGQNYNGLDIDSRNLELRTHPCIIMVKVCLAEVITRFSDTRLFLPYGDVFNIRTARV